MPLEVKYDADGTRFGLLEERLMLQHRAGDLTEAAIDAAVEIMESSLRNGAPPVGFLAVIEGGPVTSPQMQARQRRELNRFLRNTDGWVCNVTLGESEAGISMHAVGQVLLFGDDRVRYFHDIDAAAAWMAGKLGELTPSEIVESVHALRGAATPQA
jgi:hypothetical protein